MFSRKHFLFSGDQCWEWCGSTQETAEYFQDPTVIFIITLILSHVQYCNWMCRMWTVDDGLERDGIFSDRPCAVFVLLQTKNPTYMRPRVNVSQYLVIDWRKRGQLEFDSASDACTASVDRSTFVPDNYNIVIEWLRYCQDCFVGQLVLNVYCKLRV